MSETTIRAADGSGSFTAYVARPKTSPSGAVVMIQEIFGVNATMRALSDWVASMGLSRSAPTCSGGRSRACSSTPMPGRSSGSAPSP
jgi:dienelactone hydrolase